MSLEHLRGGVALVGTAAEFASANPVLLERQLSWETDTGVQKIGDGTTHYASLAALPGGGGGGASPISKLIINKSTSVELVPDDGVATRLLLDAAFWQDGTVIEQVGSDLSMTNGSIVTEAGGQFLLNLWCDFTVSGLASGEDVFVRVSIPSNGADSGGDAIWPVNLPAGTGWAIPPAQGQARCGPCTFAPGDEFIAWVNLSPLSQGTVSLEYAEFSIARIGD